MTKGAYILLTVSGTILAMSRDQSLAANLDMLETASSASADAKEYVPGRYSWQMQHTHIIGNFTESMLETMRTQKVAIDLNMRQMEVDENLFSIYGQAYIKSYKMGAPLHGFATADVELQGTNRLVPLSLELPEMIWTAEGDTQRYEWQYSRWT